MALMGTASPKPLRGSGLLARREKRQQRVAAEQKVMKEAVRFDGQKCRNPRCKHRSRNLPIDPCHVVHRGMGGNPAGDRTKLESIIAFCRVDHGRYDAGLLEIEFLTANGTRGICAFYEKNEETGLMEHIATEKAIGISEARR